MKLNIGCGKDVQEGYINIDLNSDDRRVLKLDLCKPLPFDTNSIDAILAIKVFEHLLNYQDTFNECMRVLKPNGLLVINVPCGPNGNPNHLRYIFEDSFDYLIGDHTGEYGFQFINGGQRSGVTEYKTVTRWSPIPFKYHLKKYLGLPQNWWAIAKARRFGKKNEIIQVIRKC